VARTLEIKFPETSGIDRVRNFAEELSLSLGELGKLPMDQADAATTQVTISDIPKRQLGRCKQLIDRMLKKHCMMEEATIRQVS
jgi:transcription initiation factor TFIIIB Brf1 subunit/transcription initiation factor TFIIB